MQRREFIKQLVGPDYKSLLKWTGLLVLIYFFILSDVTYTTDNIFSILKLIGVILLVCFSFFVAVFIISFICKQLIKLLPVQFVSWLKKNREIIDFFAPGLVLLYVVYDAVTNKNYFHLVFIIIYLFTSSLFMDRIKLIWKK